MKLVSHPRSRLSLLLASLAMLLAACGGDDGSGSGGSGATGIDRAFVEEMIPHHESAVEMAEMAQERGRHAEVKKLADAIVKTQNAEIDTMKKMAAAMKQAGVEKGDLGMEVEHMGMSGDTADLEEAKPFDREFIDMMIPHHQGAIRMARMELDEGKDPEARKLAQAIIDAQTKEIDEMNMWRVDWYGELSPAGGVPAEANEGSSEHH
jgi:uncharacterized protein (DUF305 family)